MTAEALDYFKSLIRAEFDRSDIQQRGEIISKVRGFGIFELDDFVQQLINDLKADL